MRIASFNINGVRARESILRRWLLSGEEKVPDVILLQELKSAEPEKFLQGIAEELNYQLLTLGQKSYNGVSILSRLPLELRKNGLFDDDNDEQARYLEARVGEKLVLASVYVPNGNPVESKLEYKLEFMDRLYARMRELLRDEPFYAIGGDYNVCPDPFLDTYDMTAYIDDALCHERSINSFRRMINLGLIDCWRSRHAGERGYSFWDYQRGSWQKNHGLRIDHFLLSPWLADLVDSCEIDSSLRSWETPSDHVPVICDLSLDK